MDVYINGKKVRADPKKAIGKGGEADVFRLDQTTALKLFKPPTHPDYQGLPQEQQAARDRIQLHQQKLPQFPHGLPSRVIAPDALATDKSGKTILGYTMPLLTDTDVLLRYSERSFRQVGVITQTVVQIFQDLHDTISKLHFRQIVIGDFNDLNVLVRDGNAYLIDADSFQFSSFPCTVFTARFVDPLLCDPMANQPILQHTLNSNSDWYAFAVMLMQCLLFVDPYGGLYKPKDPTHKVPHAARSLHRITVFHPEVHYPKPAIPYTVLPDELLHYFQQVFESDQRGEFPRSLLDTLYWTQCLNCGREHARSVCPYCQQTAAGAVKSVTTVRGMVTATRLFQTDGVILQAAVNQGQIEWVYHDRGEFRRDTGVSLLRGDRNPQLRWWIHGNMTILGYQGQVIRLHPEQPMQRTAVDSRGTAVLFAVNHVAEYWVQMGQLQKRRISHDANLYPPTYIGDVLSAQTHFWVGTRFGFGFYQAGTLKVAFVFDADKPGINDRVQLPPWQGQLIHATCSFSQEYGWLFLTTQMQGQIHYTCVLIQADGNIAATAETTSGTDHWLAIIGNNQTIATAPTCAIANILLAATDDGIIRIELQQGQLIQTKIFLDTEPFVDSSCQLLPAPNGLYVINSQEIYQLAIA
jgi:H/ACA ribonucleoprotein complex subunit 3